MVVQEVQNLKKYEGMFYAASRVRDGYGSMQFAARTLEEGLQDTELDLGPVIRGIAETALNTYRQRGSWENTELLSHTNRYAREFTRAIGESTCKDIAEWAGVTIPQEGQEKIKGYSGHKLKKVRDALQRHSARQAFDEGHRDAYKLGYEDLKMFSDIDSLARVLQRKRLRGSNGIHSQVVRQYTVEAIEEMYRDPNQIDD